MHDPIFRLRTKERDLIAEIAGGQSQNKNMGHKILQLDAQVVKQQENLYNAEFQIQQLERKVARAGGSRSDEETRLLTAKIAGITVGPGRYCPSHRRNHIDPTSLGFYGIT
jgi:hypothetical protein